VIDGSALMRRLVTRILETDPRLEVVGSARTITDALLRIQYYRPHFVTVEAGVEDEKQTAARAALLELGPQLRAVVVRGNLDERCARLMMEAMTNSPGAIIIPPGVSPAGACAGAGFAEDLLKKLWHGFGETDIRASSPRVPAKREWQRVHTRMVEPRSGIISSSSFASGVGTSLPQALVIGSSTGGPAALLSLLSALPATFSMPILIVQHMPPHFTKLLAERLTKACTLDVVEAEDGMEVAGGRAYIAPGDFHMAVLRRGNKVEVQLTKADPENSCRPAVDVLFRSVAEAYQSASIAIVLTGMGQDGLRGVRTLKQRGVPVLVQDRETSVVWGMPGAIAEAGLADFVLPITEMVPAIMRLL
jgi:two-component system chemotaxis response regulator CheB